MKNCILIILSLLFTSSAMAQSVTLKPGGAAGQDATIVLVTPSGCIPSGWGPNPPHQTPNPNSPEISMHSNTIGGLGCNQAFDRSLIRFAGINTSSVIPPGATINYAELRLYTLPTGTPNLGSNAVNVRRLANGVNWIESSVTWDWMATWWGITPGTPTPTSTAALPATSPSIPASTGPSTPGMVAVNVTSDVINFHSSPSNNKGWILELQTESPSRWMKFASSDHPNPALWPELYIDYSLPPCDPDFTWTTNTMWPALTYSFTAQNPGLTSSYNLVWTKNGPPFGSGASAQINYSQQAMGSDDICLEIYSMVTGDLVCKTCLRFCHGDFSPSLAQGGCNSHFTVSGNTNTPNQIMLAALSPGGINNWLINGGSVGGAPVQPVLLSPYYGTYYTVELDKGSGCKRWQGNLCAYENGPSGYRQSNSEENVMIDEVTESVQDGLKISPNPATNMVSIQLGNIHEGKATVNLIDVTGKVVYKAEHPVDPGTGTIKFSVAEMPAAFYNVQVEYGKQVLHSKMVKQ